MGSARTRVPFPFVSRLVHKRVLNASIPIDIVGNLTVFEFFEQTTPLRADRGAWTGQGREKEPGSEGATRGVVGGPRGNRRTESGGAHMVFEHPTGDIIVQAGEVALRDRE